MAYIQVEIQCDDSISELLIAALLDLSFDSFQETDSALLAFIEKDHYDEEALRTLLTNYKNEDGSSIHFLAEPLEEKNWNEEWEKNFDPVLIGEKVFIRATFHQPRPDIPFEIVIDPKMSFGTGHHATTSLMIRQMLTLKIENRNILDAGTGTGILAILAKKLGANKIVATDIDEWCITNSQENFELNRIEDIALLKGTIQELQLKSQFDIVLANINKNVLLDEIPTYATLLSKDGILVLSGFYETDADDIMGRAKNFNLKNINIDGLNSWACLIFEKTAQ